MSEGERSEGAPARGLDRRCHLTDKVVSSEIWYTRIVEEGRGRKRHKKRVYASPEAYWQLPEEERAAYRREFPARPPSRAPPSPAPIPREASPVGPSDRPRTTREARAPRRPVGDGVIVAQDLEKTYKDGTRAVRGISFSVRRGEIFGILGPNGAGKSTTIGMLGTLVRPTAGRAYVAGHDVVEDPAAVKPVLGFAMQDVGVDSLATGLEFLVLQGRLHGLARQAANERAWELLRLVGLEDDAKRRISGYSGGMKRKIDLASALIHEPEIIFLDEPTEGLDPRARQDLWKLLERLNQELGATILLSTHYMEEADHLCDRLAIIDEGRIVAEGTPEGLKGSIGEQSIVLEYGEADRTARLDKAQAALEREGGLRLHRTKSELVVHARNVASIAPRVLKALDNAGVGPDSLHVQKASLDDVYLATTGRSLEEAELAGETGEVA